MLKHCQFIDPITGEQCKNSNSIIICKVCGARRCNHHQTLGGWCYYFRVSAWQANMNTNKGKACYTNRAVFKNTQLSFSFKKD